MSVSAGTVEHRRDRAEAELRAGPAQVRLQNLTDVHAARHAQRIEHDLHRRAVFQERHVFDRQNLRDHALVTVAAGHLVADRDHPLRGDVHLHHLQHAAAKLVAALHRVELAVAGVDRFFDVRPQLLVRRFSASFLRCGLRMSSASILNVGRPLGDVGRILVVDQRVAVVVGHLAADDLLDLGDQLAEHRRRSARCLPSRPP